MDLETIIARVPELAGYEIDEYVAVRGRKGDVIITRDSPLIWAYERSVVDYTTTNRQLTLWIGLLESDAALQEQITVIPRAGFDVREGEITTGFHEDPNLWDPEFSPCHMLEAFAARQCHWVGLTVITCPGTEPFVDKERLEELIELVKARLLEADIHW